MWSWSRVSSSLQTIPAWLQGVWRGSFCPRGLSSALLRPSHTGRKRRATMSPDSVLAVWSWTSQPGPGHPSLFLLCATLADGHGLLFMRSKNSLGKFPEHKLRAYLERLPWNPALTHSREKDKRRKSGKGAKEGSCERPGENKCVLLCCPLHHCPQKSSPALDHLQAPPNPFSSGHLGNVTK